MSLQSSEGYSRKIIRQLVKLREEKGLTKEALAKRSGISRSMISMMESEKRHPTIVTLHALCSAMDTPASKLLAIAEHEAKKTK